MEKEASQSAVNPIDKEKVAENPHLLPYAHTVGGALIKPIDKGRIKGRAVSAMYEQTDRQLDQLRQQFELLAQQAKDIQDRVSISEKIYLADIPFNPIINYTYHLYQKKDGKEVLSMVSPREWGPNIPYTFLATVRLLGDHTWEILEKGPDFKVENTPL